MNKRYKRAVQGVILSAAATVFLVLPVTAVDEDKTEANIIFTEGNGPTAPVDPDNPGVPIDPEAPGVSGSLAIVYTTAWNFGTVEVASGTKFYPITTSRPHVQVADLRGTNTGWTLQVSVSAFTDEQGGESLAGSRVHIYNGRPNSVGNLDRAPTVSKAVLETDGTPQNVAVAKPGDGMGQWVIRWYPENDEFKPIELEIPPAAVKKGAYTATVVWSFNNTP